MRRRKFLPILAIGLLSTALAACTSFTPVYGDRTGGGVEAIRLNFATPSNRVEQLIMNRLKVAFPGQPGPNDPVLDIGASVTTLPGSQSDAYSVARPTNIRLEAALSIVGADGELLFQATRFVDTSYTTGGLASVNINANTGTQESAARSVAESLRAAILVGYRPSTAARTSAVVVE